MPDEITVRIQNPVTLSMHGEPQPGIVLPRWREIPESEEHPKPEDGLLVVEIGDSSTELDARVKLPLGAAANIPEVWLGNLKRKGVSRHTEPRDGWYTKVVRFSVRAKTSPLALPDVRIPVAAFLL